MYPNQDFEKSLLNVLTTINHNWGSFFSYEGKAKGNAEKMVSFPFYGDHEYHLIWYPNKVSFFLNNVWKYQEVKRDPKRKITTLVTTLNNQLFEEIFKELKEKKVNDNTNLLGKYGEVKMFGRNLFKLIPPQGEIVHQLDYFLN